MAKNVMFSLEELGVDGFELNPVSSESISGTNLQRQDQFHVSQEWGKSGSIDFGFCQDKSTEELLCFSGYHQEDHKQHSVNELSYQSVQTCLNNVSEPKQELQYPLPISSSEMLQNSERIDETRTDATWKKVGSSKLSAEEIIRIAGSRFIQSSSTMVETTYMFKNPFDHFLSGLSDEDVESEQLAEMLLASAEKVSNQQFERARRLLSQCDYFSSGTGNPVQRLVHYFSEALRERIDHATGRIKSKGRDDQIPSLHMSITSLNTAVLECYRTIPFTQAAHIAGVQAIIEDVAGERKVHIIDLQIGNGVQYTILMQALASQHDSPLKLLRISAIAVTTSSIEMIEETGKRLKTFADSVDIHLCFKTLMVSDMLELKEDLFEIEAGEAVAVYGEFLLQSLIVQPNHLDHMMKVIRSVHPRLMVVLEVEANVNSPSFAERFIEALFLYSIYFDSFETCMGRDDPNRNILESIFFREGIRDIVASEGEERNTRLVKIEVWRAFFARFQMEEEELSTSALLQVKLMLANFAFENCCTLDMNGKTLLIGWKGTPLHSLSVWKFN